ncbi:aldose 1-epimerase [Azospirillum argentinense]|uniref:aldose 1-epimerase n=1 Tax=Azospirillum argentinense TaxID=2970906 RepID=UPI0007C7E448|nr:aldose 1-epimerase [Azospirillum argentinense]
MRQVELDQGIGAHTLTHTLTLNRSAANGSLECTLCPERGGVVASLAWRGANGTIDLLRPASDWALRHGSAIDMGCFPLVPFSNRIAGGQFTFDGRAVRLPLDGDGNPHVIHGHGWRTAWTVEDATASSARMVFRHPADAWPWRCRATQTVVLEEDGASLTLSLVNEDDTPMPAGIGLHPYFPKPPGTRLTARVGGVWLNGPTILPVERVAVPPRWDFTTGIVMDRTVLDNGFTGWDGVAALDWPTLDRRLSIETDGPFGHLIVYAPPDADYLCVEPVSHMTDAVNRPEEPDTGLRRLEPGEELIGTMRLRLETLAR